jgi:hypothetical protein
MLTCNLRRVPQDIEPDSSVKDLRKGDENSGADKPLSLSAAGAASRAFESLNPSGAKSSPDKAKTPSHVVTKKTPQAKKPPSHVVTKGSPRTSQEKNPKESTPSQSPQSHVLGAAGGVPTRGDSDWPWVERVPQSSSRVANSLTKDSYFIKVRCHIGKYIMTAVNTETRQANIPALRNDLDSASLHINVS